MSKLSLHRLELSPKVLKSRYASYPKSMASAGGIFFVGYEECSPDYLIEREDYPFWVLEIIAGGRGYIQEEDHVRKLHHGMVFTYGPGMHQRFWNDGDRPFRKYFIACGGTDFPGQWSLVGLQPGGLMQLGNIAPIISILDQIIDEGHKTDAQTATIIAALETVLLAYISRYEGKPHGESSGARKAYDAAMEIIAREYGRLRSLKDLASRTGYSREYLCRIFRKYNGHSPYQVLLQRKMSAAWLLLRNGNAQVATIAHDLGYDDPLHFSRVFRKTMGCPPSSVKSG